MTLHTLQIVDSIASSPTVRLDLNDGTTWRCTNFEAPPPRLRRAMSENAMRDGVFVSSSSYSARELALTLVVVSSTQDANATQLQTLARELDRTDNYLKWQPAGATKPVFFRLFRSDFESLLELRGQTAAREGVVRLLAEPFALGLRETLGPYTVNNDPAAGSNGCYFDVTGVIGDVDSPCIFVNTSRLAGSMLATRRRGTPSDLVFFAQAESVTLGTDTTNPGGGPDAAMSGTGTNNFVRTSFATASMTTRLTWQASGLSIAQRQALRGTYRIFAVVRRSDSTSVITAKFGGGSTVTIPASSTRQLVDLGLKTFGGGRTKIGVAEDSNPLDDGLTIATFQAERVSGTGTLDWDLLFLVPADEQLGIIESSTTNTGFDVVLDGYADDVRYYDTGADIFAGTGDAHSVTLAMSGSLPTLRPNVTNRIYYHSGGTFSGGLLQTFVTESQSVTLHYWPRYLYIRPSAT